MIKNFKIKNDTRGKEYKFDRAYVKTLEDSFIPFRKGSYVNKYDDDYYHGNKKINNYLERFLFKQVGKDANDIFKKFYNLGFRNHKEAFDMWDEHIESNNSCSRDLLKWGEIYGFYIDENNILRYNKWSKRSGKQYVSFTDEQLKWNNTREIKSFGKVKNNPTGNIIGSANTVKYLSDFYVIYKDEVLKLPVYNIPFYYDGFCKIGSYNYIRNTNIEEKYHPISIPNKKSYLSLFDDWYGYYPGKKRIVNEDNSVSYVNTDVVGNIGYGKLHPHIIIAQAEKEYEKIMFEKRSI